MATAKKKAAQKTPKPASAAAAGKKPKPPSAGAAKKAPKAAAGGAAKKGGAPAKKVMSSTELAELLGVQLGRRMDTAAVRKLRKPLPGYVNLLDDVAAMLEEDADVLNLKDVQPARLLEAQALQKYLSAREGVVEAVYRSVYEQRMRVDDDAIGMLLKIARRIDAVSEDDPDIRVRWKSLLDFLGKFRRGPAAPAETAEPPVE